VPSLKVGTSNFAPCHILVPIVTSIWISGFPKQLFALAKQLLGLAYH
jgi:hypothetical protein